MVAILISMVRLLEQPQQGRKVVAVPRALRVELVGLQRVGQGHSKWEAMVEMVTQETRQTLGADRLHHTHPLAVP
jgi:hypothetical protein